MIGTQSAVLVQIFRGFVEEVISSAEYHPFLGSRLLIQRYCLQPVLQTAEKVVGSNSPEEISGSGMSCGLGWPESTILNLDFYYYKIKKVYIVYILLMSLICYQ